MIRELFQEVVLFLLPFGLFAILLVLQRRHVLDIEAWSKAGIWLAIGGLLLVIASFLLVGFFNEGSTGRYVPPHMEGGRAVPGHFE